MLHHVENLAVALDKRIPCCAAHLAKAPLLERPMRSSSVPTIAPEELAGLVPCPLEQVQRLIDLEILQPDDEGRFDPSQAHVVRLMAGFEAAGISVEDVARGVRSGQLSFPLGLFMPEPAPITTT